MNRKSPYRGARKYEDFRQKDVQRFANWQTDAQIHIIGRNEAVARVLCYLSVLNNSGAIQQRLVTRSGALFQSTGGTKSLDQHGAHCLPCQILTDGLDPSTLTIQGQALPRTAREGIRTQFGAVHVLARAFNIADCIAEQGLHGLAEAFLAACRHVVQCAAEPPRRETRRDVGLNYGELYLVDIWPINRPRVATAYNGIWLPLAERAYEVAGRQVDSGGGGLSEKDNPVEILWILEKYLEYNWDEPAALLDSEQSKLELEFTSAESKTPL
jgi:hypothetical protein